MLQQNFRVRFSNGAFCAKPLLNATQIRVRIKGHFEFLGVDLPILIQDVCVNLGNHVALCMTGITLRCLNISLIDFQLISCAGVTERMKNNIWKTSGFFQSFKLISNNPIFTGAARFLRQNQIVVDIVIAHKLLELVLLLFPFPQDKGKSSRNPNLTNAAFCFRLFQNEPRTVETPSSPAFDADDGAEELAEMNGDDASEAADTDGEDAGKEQEAPAKADATTDADEEKRRAEHEAAEAKRKAEWEARQAEKKKAEQEQLERLAAMSDDEVVNASMQRVNADTEKLTRRNMKECVAEFIQTKCLEDIAFARLTMHPRKSMIHCFQYISRKAWDYIQDELKASGIQPGPGSQGYGCDVPDDLCYQWAEDYFRDPDAKEDHKEEEKFVPNPYYGKDFARTTKKKQKEKKKAEAKPKPVQKEKPANDGQLSLLDLGMTKAG